MIYYVPSRARPDPVTPKTLHLYGVDRKNIVVVIRPDEVDLYAGIPWKKVILPNGVEGLSATRQWIMENAEGSIHCQIDDDITGFLIKQHVDVYGDVAKMTANVFPALQGSAIEYLLRDGVSIFSTQDRVALARPAKEVNTDYTRVGQVMYIHHRRILKAGYRFDRVRLYADQDMALQIVRGGSKTRVSNVYGHTMRPTYSPGGVQTYRDQACINESAGMLQRLHPGLVRLKWKQKGSYNVPSRIISWQKARRG